VAFWQGVNFLYMVIGGVILYPKLWHLDGSPNYTLVSREMRNLPQVKKKAAFRLKLSRADVSYLLGAVCSRKRDPEVPRLGSF